jgi:hypothetical protein
VSQQLPEPPEGTFWRIKGSVYEGVVVVQLRKKKLIGSESVESQATYPQNVAFAAKAILRRHYSDIESESYANKIIGDYPPKSLQLP